MQSFETEFRIYPFTDKGPVTAFNLLRCTQDSHPEFTASDSLMDVLVTNAQGRLGSLRPREERWQLYGDAVLSINMETGTVTIEGEPRHEALLFKVVRADLNRQ